MRHGCWWRLRHPMSPAGQERLWQQRSWSYLVMSVDQSHGFHSLSAKLSGWLLHAWRIAQSPLCRVNRTIRTYIMTIMHIIALMSEHIISRIVIWMLFEKVLEISKNIIVFTYVCMLCMDMMSMCVCLCDTMHFISHHKCRYVHLDARWERFPNLWCSCAQS